MLSPADFSRRLRSLVLIEDEARAHQRDVAFSGAYVLELVAQLRDAYQQYDAMRADRDHWRSNSEEAVRRKRVAEEYRDDFRARAIAAEERSEELERRVTELEGQTKGRAP